MFRALGKRNLIAVAISAAASGPLTLISLIGWGLTDPSFPDLTTPQWRDVVGWLTIVALSCVYGLVGAMPAAVLNSAIQFNLVKRGFAAPWISTLSGGILGVLLGYIEISIATFDSEYETKIAMMYPLGIAGVSAGLLYWFIIVRPYWRLGLLRHNASDNP